MWNKEHKIYGYHVYTEGKPRVTNEVFDPKTKSTILTVSIAAKEGGLVESVAIARYPSVGYSLVRSGIQHPDNWFIRATATVHEKDDKSIATKKRGRLIATQRVIAMIKYLKKIDDRAPNGVRIISFNDLTDREKALFEKRDEKE